MTDSIYDSRCFTTEHSFTPPPLCFPAAASAWRCASVSSRMTLRISSCVWPAGTWSELGMLAQPSSPLTPRPRWSCCRWTPAASPRWSRPHRRSNSGGSLCEALEHSGAALVLENTDAVHLIKLIILRKQISTSTAPSYHVGQVFMSSSRKTFSENESVFFSGTGTNGWIISTWTQASCQTHILMWKPFSEVSSPGKFVVFF